jgi:hypothetical protein
MLATLVMRRGHPKYKKQDGSIEKEQGKSSPTKAGCVCDGGRGDTPPSVLFFDNLLE